jgi:hypothetical protein
MEHLDYQDDKDRGYQQEWNGSDLDRQQGIDNFPIIART